MKRNKNIIIWVLLVSIGALSVNFGFRAWLLHKYPDMHLDTVPQRIAQQYHRVQDVTNWRTYEYGILALKVPPGWQKIPIKQDQDRSKVLGTENLSVVVINGRHDIRIEKYRSALYARWFFPRLANKVAIMNAANWGGDPIFEQHIGMWTAFFFSSEKKSYFYMFSDTGHRTTLIFRAKQPHVVLDEGLMKDIASTVVLRGSDNN